MSIRLSPLSRDVGCKTVANMIKGKQPEEIRKLSVSPLPVIPTFLERELMTGEKIQHRE